MGILRIPYSTGKPLFKEDQRAHGPTGPARRKDHARECLASREALKMLGDRLLVLWRPTRVQNHRLRVGCRVSGLGIYIHICIYIYGRPPPPPPRNGPTSNPNGPTSTCLRFSRHCTLPCFPVYFFVLFVLPVCFFFFCVFLFRVFLRLLCYCVFFCFFCTFRSFCTFLHFLHFLALFALFCTFCTCLCFCLISQ